MPASPQYLTLVTYKAATTILPETVDALERKRSGYVETRLQLNQGEIDSRLRKRYATPFTALPTPAVIIKWLVALTDVDVWEGRGASGQDPTFANARDARDKAYADIKEAADSKDGLYNLPVSETDQTDNVTSGGPLGYSETSPYAWTSVQARRGRCEDRNGEGTGDVEPE